MKYVRDPLYGEIKLPDEIVEIVDHPYFQKMRYIKQLDLAYLVYPSAVHTRFEHSLGVYHVTSFTTDEQSVHVYALLHDVGHSAFSHLLEDALSSLGYNFDHEERSKELSKEILRNSVFSFREVFKNKLNVLVYGGVGTDRIDYLQRDAYFTGVSIGKLDWERLIRNIQAKNGKLYISEKVIRMAEHLFIARFIMGDSVYQHKTLVVASEMFKRAVKEELENGTVSEKELVGMDDIDLISLFRASGNRWWKMIEGRKLYKIVYSTKDESKAEEVYNNLVRHFGEEHVIIAKRKRWYKSPETYVEGGTTLYSISPLVRALKKADEERTYYYVAVSKEKRKDVKDLLL